MSDTPPATPVSFPEFSPVSTAQWQAQLARELKGTDPDRLRWTLPDGLVAEPFYHREALTALGGAPVPLPPRPAPCRNVVALTVPAGTARLRLSITLNVAAREIDALAHTLAEIRA